MGVFDNIEIVNGQAVVNQWIEWILVRANIL